MAQQCNPLPGRQDNLGENPVSESERQGMDLVLAHLSSMCDSLGSFLGVAKTKNKTKQKFDTLLSWWIACLEWVTPGSTPNIAKCENNTQS